MARRGRRDPKRELFWRRTIQAWARSGETIRGFCAGRGVSEASFHAWRRELRKRDDGQEGGAAGGAAARRRTKLRAAARTGRVRAPHHPRFLPVRVVAAGTAGPAPIEIERGGTTIRLCGEVDAEVLARVLLALERASC